MKVGGLRDNVIVGVGRGDARRWDIARLNSNSVNDLECQDLGKGERLIEPTVEDLAPLI